MADFQTSEVDAKHAPVNVKFCTPSRPSKDWQLLRNKIRTWRAVEM